MKNFSHLALVLAIAAAGSFSGSCQKNSPSSSSVETPVFQAPSGQADDEADEPKPPAPTSCASALPRFKRLVPPLKRKGMSCAAVASFEGLPAPRITPTGQGFEAWDWFDRTDCLGYRGLAIQRYKADGSPNGPEISWKPSNDSGNDQVFAGNGISLWLAPDKDGNGGDDFTSWKIGCVKNGAPKRLFSYKGKYPRVVWHQDRFVVLGYDHGSITALVSEPGCGFTQSRGARVGKAETPIRDEDGNDLAGPFFSRLVSTRDAVGILLIEKRAGGFLNVRLATFQLEDGVLKPVGRTTVTKNFYYSELADDLSLGSSGENFVAGDLHFVDAIMIEQGLLGGRTLNTTAHYSLFSSKGKVAYLIGGVLHNTTVWKGVWYVTWPEGEERDWIYRVTSLRRGAREIVITNRFDRSLMSSRLTHGGSGLFVLEQDFGVLVRDDDEDEDAPHKFLAGQKHMKVNGKAVTLFSCR